MFSSDKWLSNPASGFYPHSIDQSLRFEDGDNAHLSRSPATNSTNGRNLNTTSFWVKRGNLGSTQMMYTVGSSFPNNHNDSSVIQFLSDDTLRYRTESAGSATSQLDTTRVFRDVSSWYHIHLIFDRDNSTEADRLKLYINGVRETVFDTANYPTTSQNSQFTNNKLTYIGRSTTNYFDGYIAEFVSIDSAAVSVDSFGELKDGIWVPKDVSGLTFGQNGFHLTFEATGTATTAQDTTAQTNIGDDQSGLGNNFAVSALVASDVVTDSPTNNFATMNPIHKGSGTTGSITYSEGNLASSFAGNHTTMQHAATMALPTTGKWYWEQTFTGALTGGSVAAMCGIWNDDSQDLGSNNRLTVTSDAVTFYSDDNKIYSSADGSIGNVSYTSSIAEQTGAVVSFAVDMDNTWVWVAVNGTYINGTPDFSDGTNRVDVVTDTNGRYIPFWAGDGGGTITWRVNFGQDSTNVSSANSDSNGIGTFEYAVPSGAKALCTANLPEPEIIDGSQYFSNLLWTGDGSASHAISGVGFEPSLVWTKARNTGRHHWWFDSVRGPEKWLQSSNTDPEADVDAGLISFDSDGFTYKYHGTHLFNKSGDSYVSWNWKAGGSAVSNSDGTITSSVSANPEAGFSIMTYTGNGSSSQTVGHGLGAVSSPSMLIVKNRDQGDNWIVRTNASGANRFLFLDDVSTGGTSSVALPTTDVIGLGSSGYDNASGEDYVAYLFSNVDGFSKVGIYTGLNSSDNAYVHLGFRPAWVMCKSYTQGGSGYDWVIYDNKRSPANPVGFNLEANNAIDDESVRGVPIDFLSNGFKIRNSYAEVGSNKGYIYLAFAEQPFKYSNAR